MKNMGVVIVTYSSQPVIRDCLETLFAAGHCPKTVVVDNASPDGTVATIRGWANGSTPYTLPADLPFETVPVPKPVSNLTVIQSPTNGGFAAGVNVGLHELFKDPAIDRVWVLNPDTLVPPHSPAAFAAAPVGFSLMGGRIRYADAPHSIQIDAGTLNWWTGVTSNLNLGASNACDLPDPRIADFISGASMVVSRAFFAQAGPMKEHYFLYYEEVDWAMNRGDMPLAICPNATVFHRAGSAIGSPTLNSPASAFSAYYKHRARMMFLRRHHRVALPVGYAFGIAKAVQAFLTGQRPQALAILRAINGLGLRADKPAQRRHQAIKPRA